MGKRKDSVSLNARIGADLFAVLERYCAETGQPKTVAVERAIRAYCAANSPGQRQQGEDGQDEGS